MPPRALTLVGNTAALGQPGLPKSCMGELGCCIDADGEWSKQSVRATECTQLLQCSAYSMPQGGGASCAV